MLLLVVAAVAMAKPITDPITGLLCPTPYAGANIRDPGSYPDFDVPPNIIGRCIQLREAEMAKAKTKKKRAEKSLSRPTV